MQTILRIFFCLLLSACGAGRQVYLESDEAKPLEVPTGLDQPNLENALLIPGRSAPQLAGRAEANPPLVMSSEEAAQSSTNIRYGDGALYLLIEDEIESVWRRLGFTLNRGQMSLEQRDDERRRFHFRYLQPPAPAGDRSFWDTVFFWRRSDPLDFTGQYQIQLRADDADLQRTRAYLFNGEGQPAPPEAADHLFGVIQQRLG